MFNKNLKYYRLKNNFTKTKLASMVGVSTMAITHYESGERRPDMPVIKLLAEALNVKVTDFLVSRNENLVFSHEEFRKNGKLNKSQQDYVRESVEEYFSRFFESVELLGGEVLPEAPRINTVDLSEDIEENALRLRRYLKLAESGPVGNLMELLENKGVLIYMIDIDNDGFSGINGTVNERPYIAVNKNMTAERLRTTLGHELAHFAFKWPDEMDENQKEKMATAISGAFLLPEIDAKRELGIHRKSIKTDMFMICEEYGVAMSLLVMRAKNCGIINESVCRNYFINLNRTGGRKNEKSRIPVEKPSLFPQLVYRAVNEDEITIQKGAELLQIPFEEVANHCCFVGA